MSILLGVILLFALLSGGLAAGQGVAITRLAAAGGPGPREWLFGWWRFDRVSSWAGLAGEVQAAIYKRAVIAFLVFVVLGLILSGWVVNQQVPAAPGSAAMAPMDDWRVLPAHLAENFEIRRVATMPGATVLES